MHQVPAGGGEEGEDAGVGLLLLKHHIKVFPEEDKNMQQVVSGSGRSQ